MVLGFFGWIVVVALVFLWMSVNIVNEYQRVVVFRLGRLVASRGWMPMERARSAGPAQQPSTPGTDMIARSMTSRALYAWPSGMRAMSS